MNSTHASSRAVNKVHIAIPIVSTICLLPWLSKSIWRDEGASLYSAHLSWMALWRQSRVVDLVLLPYYVLLHIMVKVSGNIEWLRLPSLIAYGLVILLVGYLGNRFGGYWTGVIAAVLTATSPLMIESALDARPYALAALAATAAVIALVWWLDSGKATWAWWFCLFSVVALLLQMFSVLVPFSALLAAIVFEPQILRQYWRRLVAPFGLLLIASVCVVALVEGQRGQVAWIPSLNTRRLAVDLVGPASGNPGIYAAVVVLGAIVAIICFFVAWKRKQTPFSKQELPSLGISLFWALIPTVALLVISLAKPIYVDRYVTSSTPGLALAVGLLSVRAFQVSGFRRAERTRKVVIQAAWVVITGLLLIGAVIVAKTVPENIEKSAQYLTDHVGAAGESALPNHSLTTAVDYYFAMDHKTIRSWPQSTDQRYIDGNDLLENKSVLSRASKNVWIVIDGSTNSTSKFTALLRKDGYVRVYTKTFGGSYYLDVVHYQKK